MRRSVKSKLQAGAAGRKRERPDGGAGQNAERRAGSPTHQAHGVARPTERQTFRRRVELQVERVGLAQGPDVNHRIVIEATPQRQAQLAQIGLREGVAETIGKRQQPSAAVKKTQHRAHFVRGEE